MNLIAYPDAEMLAMDLANRLAGELTATLEHKERALFVVPGGSTPGPVFDCLCAADLDWSRVDVLLSDERWLPEIHIRSNTRLVRERLLTGRAAAAQLVPLYVRDQTPEASLAELGDAIAPKLPIDVCLLGMGSDMHTASLFPGAPNLQNALAHDAPTLVAMRPDDVPEARITLSAPVLRGALALHIVIVGPEKRVAVETAQSVGLPQAPVAAVLDQASVHWAAA